MFNAYAGAEQIVMLYIIVYLTVQCELITLMVQQVRYLYDIAYLPSVDSEEKQEPWGDR